MAELRFVEGDAAWPIGDGPQVIVHICNDLGVWGSGFVMAISRRWPHVRDQYLSWSREDRFAEGNTFHLGGLQILEVEPRLWVGNLVAQHGIMRVGNESPIRYSALGQTLLDVSVFALKKSASVHMPRIGTGRAGGKWDRVEYIIRGALVDRGVDVTVYDWVPVG